MIHTPPSARGAVSLKSVTEPERLALLRSLAESDTITTTCDASLLIGGVCFGLTGVVHWVGLGLLGRVRDRDLSGRVVFKVVPVPGLWRSHNPRLLACSQPGALSRECLTAQR